jgi:hypothetical protein
VARFIDALQFLNLCRLKVATGWIFVKFRKGLARSQYAVKDVIGWFLAKKYKTNCTELAR